MRVDGDHAVAALLQERGDAAGVAVRARRCPDHCPRTHALEDAANHFVVHTALLPRPRAVYAQVLRVALFITCFNDTLFPRTGQAVVRLLERLGHEVEFRAEQTCCGQMHLNSGYAAEAGALARRFARVFDGADAVVSPSASCVATVRHGYARLGVAAPPVFELTEFLVDRLGVEDVGAYFPHRVTYHPTCHGLRLLGLGDRPLRLLRAVRGIDLVDLPEAEECCGFGGTFAVKNADVSTAMLADKMRRVLDTGAEVVTAADNSCLMHIGGGLSRGRAGTRALHLAEILASAP
jgi:L-lactate dehydrogenase complex protein LldE